MLNLKCSTGFWGRKVQRSSFEKGVRGLYSRLSGSKMKIGVFHVVMLMCVSDVLHVITIFMDNVGNVVLNLCHSVFYLPLYLLK